LASIGGRLIGVNGFLCECFAFLACRAGSGPTPSEKRAGQNVRLLISFAPLVYPRCAAVKTLAD
jgi:hypothetical protein